MMYVKITGYTPKEGLDKGTTGRFWRNLISDVVDVSYAETFTEDGKRYVDLSISLENGDTQGYRIVGTAYVMSENGKTIDTIAGGDTDETLDPWMPIQSKEVSNEEFAKIVNDSLKDENCNPDARKVCGFKSRKE